MSVPPDSQDFFLTQKNIPEDWPQAWNFFNQYFKIITRMINSRTLGYNSTQVSPSGEVVVLGGSDDSVDVYRKIISIGTLSTTSVPHDLVVTDDFRVFNLRLMASDPVNKDYFCLTYYSLESSDSIRLSLDATDVIIQTNDDYSSYTDCIVLVEYMVKK